LTGLNTYTELSSSPDCSGYKPLAGNTWNYSYNPSGEREQKRLVYTPLRNFGGGVYAWEYYLLGGTNEQLAVYQGVEQSDEVIAGLAPDGTPCSIPNPPNGYAPVGQPSVSKVFFYPAEFNVYGLGGAPLTWRADSVGQWRKEYKLFDHLGSVRTVLRKRLTDNSYELREQISYEPFGDVKERLYCTGSANPDARLNYIGKQKDGESSLADHGVRKYDYELGRFTSPDPLWEKYYAWTPYHYCGNNPVMAVDPSGLNWFQKKDDNGNPIQNNLVWVGAEGDFCKDGLYYEDFGTNALYFDGEYLSLYKEDLTVTKYPAVSGELTDGKTDPSKQMKLNGPIPEGDIYTIDPQAMQFWKDLSCWDQLKGSIIGLGTWPGGTDSWGTMRIPIYPQSYNIGERTGGWFIHGGESFGSRGCIDLSIYNEAFMQNVVKIHSTIRLMVNY